MPVDVSGIQALRRVYGRAQAGGGGSGRGPAFSGAQQLGHVQLQLGAAGAGGRTAADRGALERVCARGHTRSRAHSLPETQLGLGARGVSGVTQLCQT